MRAKYRTSGDAVKSITAISFIDCSNSVREPLFDPPLQDISFGHNYEASVSQAFTMTDSVGRAIGVPNVCCQATPGLYNFEYSNLSGVAEFFY